MKSLFQFTFGLFLVLGISNILLAQISEQERYSEVRIYATDEGLHDLDLLGLPVDHGHHKSNTYFTTILSQSEIEVLEGSGYTYDVTIPDMVKYRTERQAYLDAHPELNQVQKDNSACSGSQDASEIEVPTNFELGSMAGFFTYEEMHYHLDNMATLYPELITVKAPISDFESHEGEPIYWLKISDNPNIDETDEPEVLYTSVHHAREPGSLSQLIFFMYYILENYQSDPSINALINSTEMYFVPCVNPDGYKYNQSTNPDGYGYWRKNRRNNENGTYGVDLNRNYGYFWGYDEQGSSIETDSDVYRGPEAFSEPETQAIKYFCENHEFQLAFNYHTYSDLLIYPWGFIGSYLTPDSLQFEAYADLLTKDNNYLAGTGDQTVGYLVNGDSDDWMYGEQDTKEKIIVFTPEVGAQSEGFWPASNRIIPQAQENITANLNLSRLAGVFAEAKDKSPSAITLASNQVEVSVQRLGMKDGPINLILSALSDNIVGLPISQEFSTLELLETVDFTANFGFTEDIAQGDEVRYQIAIDNNEGYISTFEVTRIFGTPTEMYSNTNSELSEFTSDNWDLSFTDFVSPESSITDSPIGDYPAATTNEIQLNTEINLENVLDARLQFWAKWDIEAAYDYVQVNARTSNGSINPLCGKYTKPGTVNQDFEQPIYDGIQSDWVLEEINLCDFLGETINISFTLISDNYTEGDGFYFDDLKVVVIDEEEESTGTETINLNPHLILGPSKPNPNNGSAIIDYSIPSSSDNWSLVAFNSLGQEMVRQEVETGKQLQSLEINTASWMPGLYYFYLESRYTKSEVRKMSVIK